jgi:hypothetical protein
MNAELLDDIAVTLDTETVIERLHLGERADSFKSLFDELLDRALPVAKPKALFKVSFIDGRKGDCVHIDGVEFQSSILRQNLENVERVFPYIVTAGRELDTSIGDESDVMKKFCLDAIKECILEDAYLELETTIKRRFRPGTMAHMNPGSLKDWPLSQQPRLFSLFGDVEKLIGVKLTASNLMDPIKSVSGMQFPTELDFKSCKLCTRHPCVKRRAPYDPALAKHYGTA